MPRDKQAQMRALVIIIETLQKNIPPIKWGSGDVAQSVRHEIAMLQEKLRLLRENYAPLEVK